ncbi:hypothetical protein BKA82DRAFT_4154558, partial [Pisolithus tinctorius]
MDSLLIEPCFSVVCPPVYARSLLCFFALAAPRMSAYTMPDLLGKAFFQNQSKGGQAISCRTQPPSNSRTNRRRDIHHWHAAFPEEIRKPMASRMAVL